VREGLYFDFEDETYDLDLICPHVFEAGKVIIMCEKLETQKRLTESHLLSVQKHFIVY
jgi:hypothetical protein